MNEKKCKGVFVFLGECLSGWFGRPRGEGQFVTLGARETFARFGWQTGYGVFSVSESNVAAVSEYIAGQQEHHKKHSFQEEFVAFLKKNHVEYDERYIWD